MYVLKKGGAKAKKVAPNSQKKQAKKKPQKKKQQKGEHKPKKKPEQAPPEPKVETPAPVEAKTETPPVEEKKPEPKADPKPVADDGVLAKPENKTPEEKPKEPEKPKPSSCVHLFLRGDSKIVPDVAHHRFIQRTSGKNGVLQVVPEPREIVNIGWGTEAMEDWESNKEVFEALRGHLKPKAGRTWDQLLAAGRDLKKKQEEAEAAKKGHHGWEFEVGLSYKGGFLAKKVPVEIIADFTPEEQDDAKSCVVKNSVGKAFKAEPFEEKELKELEEHNPPAKGRKRKAWKVEVEHVGNGWGFNAKPTQYTVAVKGGDGKEKKAFIEVLPPTISTFEFEMGSKKDKSNALEKLNSWLDKIGGEGAKFELKIGGGYEFFWGWKEQIEDSGEESQIWRSVYCIEGSAGMKPLIGAKFELTVSALQIAFGMPQCLTKHIADVRLGIGLSGSVSVVGFFETKYLVGGRQMGTTGGIKGTGNLSFGLELSAFAGSKVIYQIEAKGGVRTGITVEGAFEFSHEGVDLKHQGQWDGVVLECSVTSYYLVYGSHEHAKGEWKVFDKALLWQKTKPLKRWEDKKIGEKKE